MINSYAARCSCPIVPTIGGRHVIRRADNILREANEQANQNKRADQRQKDQQSFQHNSPSAMNFLACTSSFRRTLTQSQRTPLPIAIREHKIAPAYLASCIVHPAQIRASMHCVYDSA